MRYSMMVLSILVLLSLCPSSLSQSILIFDREEHDYFFDPEGSGLVTCLYAIEKTLTENNHTYTTVTDLPADLGSYDILFVIMGIFE